MNQTNCNHPSLSAIGTMTLGVSQDRFGVLACDHCGKNFFQQVDDSKNTLYHTVGDPDALFPIVKFEIHNYANQF